MRSECSERGMPPLVPIPTLSPWRCGHESPLPRGRHCVSARGGRDERDPREPAARGRPGGAVADSAAAARRPPSLGVHLPRRARRRNGRSGRRLLPEGAADPPRLGHAHHPRRSRDGRAHVPGQVTAELDVSHLDRLHHRGGAALAARAARPDPARADDPGVAEGTLPVAARGLQHLELHAGRARGVGDSARDRGARHRRDREQRCTLCGRRARRLCRLGHRQPHLPQHRPQARAQPYVP